MAIEKVNSKHVIEGGLAGPVFASAKARAQHCSMCADLMRYPRWHQKGRGFVHLDRYECCSVPCGSEPLCKVQK